jgi:hypothetical protein
MSHISLSLSLSLSLCLSLSLSVCVCVCVFLFLFFLGSAGGLTQGLKLANKQAFYQLSPSASPLYCLLFLR